MKKFIFVCLILLFLIASLGLISNAKNKNMQWSKINKYIYFDKDSIIKNNHSVSGWFKIYDSPKNRLYKINDVNIYYQINQYEVECSRPITISIAHSKSYDRNNNLLDEYINEQGYACSYPCLINDDIFVKELCK